MSAARSLPVHRNSRVRTQDDPGILSAQAHRHGRALARRLPDREACAMNAATRLHHYASGRPYTAACGHSGRERTSHAFRRPAPIRVDEATDWATFWARVTSELSLRGYGSDTQALYRSVLRNLYRHTRCSPGRVDEPMIRDYFLHLAQTQYSWHWMGMTLSALRTVFDKLCGKTLTTRLVTPKRSFALPEILSREEIRDLLVAASTPRDQLLLGLLYGCGLKPGQLARLTWADIDPNAGILRIRAGRESRDLEIPPDLIPILTYGKDRCPAEDFVLQGRYAGSALSLRMIELTVRRARNAAGILKPVTAMSLRHAYAVHSLESGVSARTVQTALGHKDIRTTMRYVRCTLPDNLESPLDRLKRNQRARAQEQEPAASNRAPLPERPGLNLFDEPPSVECLELPFREPGSDGPAGFYRLLKTHVFDRFLGLRRFSSRGG